MAGPVASVLVRVKLTDEQATSLRDGIRRIADSVNGSDFWLKQRPFILMVGPEYPGAMSEVLENGLPELLGWLPEDVVTFAAMCNGEEDHRLLAQLCIDLAEKHAGIVDFGGHLSIDPRARNHEPGKAVRIENPSGVLGTLFATSCSHYGDVAFVRSWLRHADFRMVK